MAARLTLIAVPDDTDRRAPRFPGRDLLDLPFESMPEPVRRSVAEADQLIHAPEIVPGSNPAVRAQSEADAALADLDYGRWARRTMAEIAQTDPGGFALWRTDMAAAPHGGESLVNARARVGRWLASLEARSGAIVALCPATITRIALVAALDAPAADDLAARPHAMVGNRADAPSRPMGLETRLAPGGAGRHKCIALLPAAHL